jgi:gamma-tubulin complex component 2
MSHHCQTLDTEVRGKSRFLSFTCSELPAEPSFISEESFVRAPLNSRIVSGTAAPRSKGKAREEHLDTFPLDVQEALILEDLLFVLMVSDTPPFYATLPRRDEQGIEGTHITYHEDYSPEDDGELQGIRFAVSDRLGAQSAFRPSAEHTLNIVSDPSLRDLVERVLPLAKYYTAISSFIELRSHLDFGRVNHALCAALRDMLKVCSDNYLHP